MQNQKLLWLLCLLVSSNLLFAQPSAVIRDYIGKYRDIAVEEMKRTGVPAAITLAQGIHETEAGRSVLVLKSNNHFGIKCKSTWTGESVSHDDDARGECFRKYADPLDSYKDHSDFLRNGTRYAFLFDLDPADYEGWAAGLKKAGYATNPKYPQILIRLIRDYNLQDYTLVALGRKEMGEIDEMWTKGNSKQPESVGAEEAKTYPEGVFTINRTSVIYVDKGVSYLSIAQEHKLSLSRLFEFNDMQPADETEKPMLLYLQRKRKEGATEVHKVALGETLHDIAQAEGVRLESLYTYNYLKEGVNPAPGRELYLRGAESGGSSVKEKFKEVISIFSPKEGKREERKDEYTTHVVQPKETVYAISKKYAVTVEEVLQWNDLQTTDLRAGQQLRINKKSDHAN